jgi:cytosine/adenosine deaminase-related metal-dependent hydrolase
VSESNVTIVTRRPGALRRSRILLFIVTRYEDGFLHERTIYLAIIRVHQLLCVAPLVHTDESFQDSFAHLSPQVRPVEPVITPRFVPSCSNELFRNIGELAEASGMRIQSHLAEARDQVDWVRKERGAEDVEVLHRVSVDCELYSID